MHNEFKVHILPPQGIADARAIADAFDLLLTRLEQLCPPGRELQLVKTKLEEAAFFAKKAMANEYPEAP